MKKKEKFQLEGDSFLRELLESFTVQELELMNRYSLLDHHRVVNKDAKLEWDKSYILHIKVYKAITENLFDVSDENGFPKAKAFIDVFLPEKEYYITIGEIAKIYIFRIYHERRAT